MLMRVDLRRVVIEIGLVVVNELVADSIIMIAKSLVSDKSPEEFTSLSKIGFSSVVPL